MKNVRCGLLACASLLALLISGCGSSSSSNQSVPSTITLFQVHSAIFRNRTTVVTAGYNAFGQLGSGSLDQRELFDKVPGLPVMNHLAVGAVHTLAFRNNSTMYAWGSNSNGQLGNGGSGAGVASSTPSRVDLHGVTSVAAGVYHSLAVSNGGVYAWGANSSGQLGINSSDQKTLPTPVPLGAGAKALQVAAGNLFSAAIIDDGSGTKGVVYAWGDNSYGQLGKNPATANSLVPVKVQLADGTDLADVVEISAGGAFCVARKSDGTVWAWGNNGLGQLGKDPIATPISFKPVQIALPAPAVQVAAGISHTLALLLDGTVWAWGFDYYGQLGDNNKDAHNFSIGTTNTSLSVTPVQVLTAGGGTTGIAPSPLANANTIYAYGDSSFAQATSGLYAWGNNSRGQLGLSVNTTDIGYLLLPQLIFQPLP